jgi:hypothetical protein
VLLEDGQLARAETVYEQALESGRRVQHALVVFLSLTGMAVVHRLHRRSAAAIDAAEEALEVYRAGGPRRFRNRIDHEADLRRAAAACCSVLAGVAAEADEPEEAAVLLGQVERLHADAGTEIASFQRDDVEQARAAAVAALGAAAFVAAFERGRLEDRASVLS